jgi:hypothetical protein
MRRGFCAPEPGEGLTVLTGALSSDGHTLAVLSFSGAKIGDPLWIVLEDVNTGKITAAKPIGHRVFPTGNFTPQVLYSSDQHYLAVQDLSQIIILNSVDLTPLLDQVR